jgi:hypothetical protein
LRQNMWSVRCIERDVGEERLLCGTFLIHPLNRLMNYQQLIN